MAGSTVLVVDDEPRIVEFLTENLRDDDFSVLSASTGAEAIDLLGRSRPDVILLDVVLPDMSGYDICRTVRGGDGINDPWDPDLAIIMLSAKAEHTDRVRGLVRGADDYVTKPFHYPELLARIGAVLARVSRGRDRQVIRHGELAVNMLSREVTVGGIRLDLSAKEFQLLTTLASEPERVFTKKELLETVWGFRSQGRTRTLDSHASRLRQKLRASFGRRVDRQRVGRRLPAVQAGMIRDALRRRRGDVDERLQASVDELSTLLAREERARAEFIGKVSHELRTPLTVIKGYVYTLHRAESDPAKAAKLDVIDGECERLGYLIEDLLELSRARAGELRVHAEVFPLERCVSEVAERLQTVAERGGVRVRLDWSCNGGLVRGDQNRVRQIFANLITNGIKYAPPGTDVTVRGTQVGDALQVDVEDAGRGIAEADLPFIFDEFFQADRPEPGAGLGLAIARELTEAHGGSIDVRSAVGSGTRFTVTLPRWSAE